MPSTSDINMYTDEKLAASANDIVNANTKDNAKSAKKPKKAAKKKIDDGRPRRPLTSYNIFFQMQRKIIMQEYKDERTPTSNMSSKDRSRIGKHANVGFANLARIVSDRWKALDADAKKMLQDQARLDKERYKREMEEWESKKEGLGQEDNAETTKSNPTKEMETCYYRRVSTSEYSEGDDYSLSLASSTDDSWNKCTSGNCVSPDASRRASAFFNDTRSQMSFPAPPLYSVCQESISFCAPCPPADECYSASFEKRSHNMQYEYDRMRSSTFEMRQACYNAFNNACASNLTSAEAFQFDKRFNDYSHMDNVDYSLQEMKDIFRGLRETRRY